MAGSVLEELVTVLGYEIDDTDLKKYDKTLVAIRGGMKAFTIAAAAAGAGIAVFTQHAAASNDALFLFSRTVGDTFEDLQRFTHATKVMGGSIEDVMGTIRALENIASTAAMGQGGGDLFGFVGITPTEEGRIKKGIPLFKEIADALMAIDDVQRRTDLAGRFGISPRQILLLQQGSEGIEKLANEMDRIGFILTEKQGQDIREFMATLERMDTVVRGIGNQLVLRFAPQITEVIDRFIEWSAANRDVIESGLDVWLAELGKLVGPAKLIAGILLVMFVAANAANLAIGALVLTFAGLMDDILEFRKGNENTLTGKALEAFDRFQKRHPNVQRAVELHGGSGLFGAIDDQAFGGIFDDIGLFLLGDSRFGREAQERRGGTTHNDITIEVSGAQSPTSTGSAVVDSLIEYFRNEREAVTVGPRT